MSVKTTPIIEPYEGSSYTQVSFIVDFARFYDQDETFGFHGKREYTLEMLRVYAKHACDISATANVKVFFNRKMIDCTGENGMGILKYGQLYFPDSGIASMGLTSSSHILYQSSDSMCLMVDTPNAGITVSFVNGVINEEGGVHVDAWKKALFKPIIEHLKGKVKGLNIQVKEKDISEHISMILICRLINPKYRAQTKDKVTSPKPTVSTTLPDGTAVNAKALCEWKGVKKLEEILKARINAISKASDGQKKKLVGIDKLKDALHAGGPESLKCTLMITEGDSAANFAVKGIEDGGYTGSMPIKGKLLNVGTCDIKQYAENVEIAMLKQALGLREGMDYTEAASLNSLRYGRLVILSDQDVDGMHIRGLIHNFFRLKFPSLLSIGYVQVMETPLLRVKYGGKVIPFYYQREYDEWVKEKVDEEQKRRKCKVDYFKGLGSSNDEQLLDAFRVARYITLSWDEKADNLMAVAFDEGFEDDRKEWLMTWDPIKREGMYAGQFAPDTISHFVTNQLCEFSHTNVQRTIPGLDGLKQCQRKVLAVLLKMSGAKKVSQLKGQIAHDMHYRYGEEALYRTIVGMGNYYVGSNNVPLIQAEGQYDSREGKKAAADRYISASPSPILKYIFRPEDNCILEHNYDGDDEIEPKLYYPILPLFALNGARGIGTGFSTNIPAHNPIDLMKYIFWWLKVKTGQISTIPGGHTITLSDGTSKQIPYECPPILQPWYRNYAGKIQKLGKDWYSVGAYEEIPSRKRVKDVRVTEIPVTQTISTYKKFLDTLKEKPLMTKWEGPGKCPPYIEAYKDIPRNAKYKIGGKTYIEVLPDIIIEGATCGQMNGGYIRTLGLIEKISDSNIVLLDQEGRPHQYVHDDRIGGSVVTNAIDAYCSLRYNAYVDRRKKKLDLWTAEIQHNELKKQFIAEVVNGTISLRGKTKSALLADINGKYPEKFLDLSVYKLTLDGISEIDRDIAKLQAQCEDYRNTSPAWMWIRELTELEKHLPQ